MPPVPNTDDVDRIISYDPHSGVITWKQREDRARRWNSRCAGKSAGTTCSGGYIGLRINGRRYLAHRLAWLLFYGEWPAENIDHINGDGRDNRIANLRACNQSENHQNRSRQGNNTSGIIGVSPARGGMWVANIHIKKKQIYLGRFATKEDAGLAYAAAKARIHTFQPKPPHT